VEKNEGRGREFQRMAGDCRQTMSDMVYGLHNKQCAWEKTKKAKQIIKGSKYQDNTEPIIRLRALFFL